MTRLEKTEVRNNKEWFAEWHPPLISLEHAEQLMDHMADENGISGDLFTQPGVDFILEMFAAATFASLRDADAVKLILEDQPDFEIRINDQEEPWELTEADVIGRRRGDEYRKMAEAEKVAKGKERVEGDAVEDWIKRAGQVGEILRDRATKKAGKKYRDGTNLLIYLNINEFGIRRREIEACMTSSTAVAKDVFASVWILWQGRAYEL